MDLKIAATGETGAEMEFQLQERQSRRATPRHRNAGVQQTFSHDTASSFQLSVPSEERKQSEKEIYEKAREYLNPGRFFRFVVYLYAERKLLVFFLLHFVSTMIIWTHFGLVKFQQQEMAVPEGANRYWWKRLVPALEFGSMHAILFQMALLPLTMSRLSIASLADTVVDRFVPLNRAMRIHIHLGYVMISIVVTATALFFTFFGVLCNDGEQAFCDKFTSEIMITGYGIIALLLLVGVTSYFRHQIPYEIFYAIHHAVFVMYLLTILHTFDSNQRKGSQERSQTFKWFSSTLIYYVCDRVAMHLNHRYKVPIESTTAVAGNAGDARLILLKIRKPTLFQFKPGQYAFLRVSEIDVQWHPFSIASGPSSDCLEFYIEVHGEDSWTGKLWRDIIGGDGKEGGLTQQRQIYVEVMGPYGTPLANTNNYTHAMAIGGGTGIVPLLSLFKQHAGNLLRLDPDTYLREVDRHQRCAVDYEKAKAPRKGSIAEKLTQRCRGKAGVAPLIRRDVMTHSIRSSIRRHNDLDGPESVRWNMKQMKNAAFNATRSLYGIVALILLPVFGMALVGLTISWNTIPIELYDGQLESLAAMTIIFQFLFVIVSVFIWDGDNFSVFVDVAVCLASPVLDWIWFGRMEAEGILRATDVTVYSLVIGYMSLRLWDRAVRPRYISWRECVENDRLTSLDCLEVVWITRSASLVSEIVPDVNETWKTLVASWGVHNARKVCRFSIYVTDPDERACALLRRELCSLELVQNGGILAFGRPDLEALVEDHRLELVCSRRNSYSLLAFCGSPSLARVIHHHKISNDMITTITGHHNHQMEFVSDSYGGCTRGKRSSEEEEQQQQQQGREIVAREESLHSSAESLSTRKETTYMDGMPLLEDRFAAI